MAELHDSFDHGTVDIRQAEVSPLESVRELFVVNSHLVQNGGLKVVNMDGIFHSIESQIIGSAPRDSGFHAAAGHPDREGIGVMIAPPSCAVVDVALNERGASKLASPND